MPKHFVGLNITLQFVLLVFLVDSIILISCSGVSLFLYGFLMYMDKIGQRNQV